MECVLYRGRNFFSSCSLVIRSTDAFVSTRVVGLRTWNWTDNAPYRFPCLPLGLRPKPRVRFVHTAKRTMTQMPLFGGVSFACRRSVCTVNIAFIISSRPFARYRACAVVVRGEIQKSSAKSLGFIYKSLCTNFCSIASGYYSGLVERLRMSTREGQVCPTFFTRQSRLFSIFKSSQSDFLKKQVHWIICKMARRFIKFGILPERTTDVLVTHSCGMHSDRNGSIPSF